MMETTTLALNRLIAPQRYSLKRIGRGESSGQGKTAGRGQKGQKARSGGRVRPGFEGGQMPLFRRIPKFHATRQATRTRAVVIAVAQLNRYSTQSIVSPKTLLAAGLISKNHALVKILANGELKVAVTVVDCLVSRAARKLIIDAGGSVAGVSQRGVNQQQVDR